MKILFYRHSYNVDFESIIQAISKTKNSFGYLSGEINRESIHQFDPDIILHNIPDVDSFPIENKAISVNINETDSNNSFSLRNPTHKNFIKPFVSLKHIVEDSDEKKKFLCDVVYIGSPLIFEKVIEFLINEDSDIRFKFFTHQLHNINGYCGMCDAKDYLSFYNNAKCSLVKEDDLRRIMDIVISDGNPIVFNGSNTEECIDKIKNAVCNKAKYSIDGFSKENILKNDTAYDRASYIFKTIGLKKIAENILAKKDWDKK